MSAHTPTPWRVYPSGTLVPGYQVCDRIVANKFHGGISEQLSDADADFIVRAVNAHDELCQTLSDIEWDMVRDDFKSEQDRRDYVLRNVRAALAKART